MGDECDPWLFVISPPQKNQALDFLAVNSTNAVNICSVDMNVEDEKCSKWFLMMLQK